MCLKIYMDDLFTYYVVDLKKNFFIKKRNFIGTISYGLLMWANRRLQIVKRYVIIVDIFYAQMLGGVRGR